MKTRQTKPLSPPSSALPKSGVFDKAKGAGNPTPIDQTAPEDRPGSEFERPSAMTREKARGGISVEPAPVGAVAVVEVVKEVSEASGAADQHRPSQVRSKRAPLSPQIRAAVSAAADHKKLFGPLSREQAKAMVQAYKATLMPRRKPGRKPSERTVQGARLRSQGVDWPEVYKQLGYHFSDKYERTYETNSLRRRVRAYMDRHGMISKRGKYART